MPAGVLEPVVPLAGVPGKVRLELSDLESLYDRSASPVYPHTGPMLNRSVVAFLTDATREQRHERSVEVTLSLEGPAPSPTEEETTRARLHRFFLNEAELTELELRVNRSEGLGSLRYAIPLVVVAGFIAILTGSGVGPWGYGSGIVELVYIVVVVVVWVLLWDPIEKLLFDPYLLRLRLRALRKLENAAVRFEYRPGPGGPH